MKRAISAVAIVAFSGATTLVAIQPVFRALTKIGGEAAHVARFAFWRESLGCLLVGLAFAAAGAICIDRRPRLAIVLLVAAPIAAMLTDFLILLMLSERP